MSADCAGMAMERYHRFIARSDAALDELEGPGRSKLSSRKRDRLRHEWRECLAVATEFRRFADELRAANRS